MDKIKKRKLIIAVFISLLMITSIAGFISLPSDNQNNFVTKTYEGIEFANINNKWVTNRNNIQIALSFDPEVIGEQDIVNINLLNLGEKIYFSSDQNETNFRIFQELNQLTQLLKPKVINSCHIENEICKNLPLKTCSDAKDLNKVIVIKKDTIKNIKYANNCLEISGTETEIIKFIDQMILSILTKK
jgi:hypothetical protein